MGVEVVQGSFSDTALITLHARAADITVNTADSDDVALGSAILAGQRARVVDDGKPPPVLVHTSGVAVFSDGGTEGKHDTTKKIWDVRLPRLSLCLRSEEFYRIALKRIFVPSLLRCCMAKSRCRMSFLYCVRVPLERTILGSCEHRKKATPSPTLYAPQPSLGRPQDQSAPARSSSTSPPNF